MEEAVEATDRQDQAEAGALYSPRIYIFTLGLSDPTCRSAERTMSPMQPKCGTQFSSKEFEKDSLRDIH